MEEVFQHDMHLFKIFNAAEYSSKEHTELNGFESISSSNTSIMTQLNRVAWKKIALKWEFNSPDFEQSNSNTHSVAAIIHCHIKAVINDLYKPII